MKKFLLTTVCLVMISATAWGQTQTVKATSSSSSADERLIRLEEGQKYLRDEMKALRDEIREVRVQLQGFMHWGFGLTVGGMFALIGFVLWDRRTALAPVVRQTRELSAREEKILTVLRDYAKEDARLSEIMKRLGLW